MKGDNMTKPLITVEGMTLREISDKSGVPLETVRHRYTRGLRTLPELSKDDNLHNNEYRLEVACDKGRRFLQAVMDRDLSLEQVMKRSGVHRSCIWNFIYNDGDISSLRLAKLCGVVGCSMDYVMGLKR